MRTRLRIVMAVAAVAFIGWLGWKVLCPAEPSYQGKSLSEWLDEYNRAGSTDKIGPVSEAIRAMGTNSLPFLLANIRPADSPRAKKFFDLVQQQHLVKLPFHE